MGFMRYGQRASFRNSYSEKDINKISAIMKKDEQSHNSTVHLFIMRSYRNPQK